MWNSLTRTVLVVVGACLLAAASCDSNYPSPDPDHDPGPAMCGGIAGLACSDASTYCAMPLG